MDCEIYRDLLFEFVRGELEQRTERDLGAHVKGCPGCRADLATVRRIDALVRGGDTLPGPSRELTLRVKDAVHQELRREPAGCQRVPGEVMNVEELADYLRVDVTAIYGELEQLPAFEFGGLLLFRKGSVDAWIEAQEAAFRMRLSASELRGARVRGGA